MHGVTNMLRCHSRAEVGIVAMSSMAQLDVLMGDKWRATWLPKRETFE